MSVPILLQTGNTEVTAEWGSAAHPLRGTVGALHHGVPRRTCMKVPSNHMVMFGCPEPKEAFHEHLLAQILDRKVPTTLSHGQYPPEASPFLMEAQRRSLA